MSATSSSDMMTPEAVPERARRACEKCTRTKKKCDKALPKCGRCSRLSTTCCYNFYAPPTLASADLSFYHALLQQRTDDAFSTVPAFSSNFPSSETSSSSPAAWAHSLPVLAPVPPPPQRSSSPDSVSHPVDLDLSAHDLLAMISAQGMSWREVLDLYYERIHHWIGIVHPEYFRAKIAGLAPGEDPADVETALLLLCMYLAVRPAQDGGATETNHHAPLGQHRAPSPFGVNYPTPEPASRRSSTPPLPSWPSSLPMPLSRGSTPPPGVGRSAETNHMLSSPLYRTAKRMLVLLRAFCPPNIELVQAGTLLALYELGHDDPWRAYVTFGEAIAMSKLIGIRPGLWSRDVPEHEPVDAHEDQMCSLYWALFVLDKMLHFDFAFVACPLQMPLPPPNSLLPAQNHLWSVQEGRRVEFWRRIPYSAPHTKKRLGPFQRAIQAAVIAHRAMLWEETVRLSGPGRSPGSSRAAFFDLDAQARNLVEVIIFQEQAFTEDCEALGMCFGVMLMLHATALGDRFDERPARRDPKIAALGCSSLLPGFLEEDLPRVMAGINFVVRMVGDSSADANVRMQSRGAGLSSVFSPATVYAAYHALRVLATLETVVENAEDRFHEIYTCVASLGRRWMLAGRLLGTVETLMEDRVSDDGDSNFGTHDFSACFSAMDQR